MCHEGSSLRLHAAAFSLAGHASHFACCAQCRCALPVQSNRVLAGSQACYYVRRHAMLPNMASPDMSPGLACCCIAPNMALLCLTPCRWMSARQPSNRLRTPACRGHRCWSAPTWLLGEGDGVHGGASDGGVPHSPTPRRAALACSYLLVSLHMLCRGLDIPGRVDHVINFDFPLNPVDYLHRTGRTARAGATGAGRMPATCNTGAGVYCSLCCHNQIIAAPLGHALQPACS